MVWHTGGISNSEFVFGIVPLRDSGMMFWCGNELAKVVNWITTTTTSPELIHPFKTLHSCYVASALVLDSGSSMEPLWYGLGDLKAGNSWDCLKSSLL